MYSIRKSVASGTFYPSDKATLSKLIDNCMSEIPITNIKDSKGFIIPHAGYIYSGKTASYAYSIIKKINPENIIIIGPSHKVSFDGFSIDTKEKYETPLVNLDINKKITNKLLQSNNTFSYKEEAHKVEHSIDVQIPFIAHSCPKAKITCIIAGNISGEQLNNATTLISKILNEHHNTIVIASTDLSHFHNSDQAIKKDNTAINAIINMDGQELLDSYRKQKAELCGLIPVLALMKIMDNSGYTSPNMLNYSHSGYSSGDNSSVVGYTSIIFEKEQDEIDINNQLKVYLLNLARNSIKKKLGLQVTELKEPENPLLRKKRGAFVTLHKQGQLRGCIGHIKAFSPLKETIIEMAESAAFKDARFLALNNEEFDIIDIEISVLSPIYKIDNINDIIVGRHGIIISRGSCSGLLLPQVATEWGWDKETFLSQTCIKAGLNQDAWKKDAEISIFSAEIFGEKEMGLI